MARRVSGVHDAHARRVHGDHRRDRVGLLARLHRLGRDGHQVVGVRRARDMQLRAADHHAAGLAINDAHVHVRIVLLHRRQRAIALRVGDALGDANVVALRSVDVRADPFDVLGRVAHLRRRSHQGHDRLVGDVGDEVRRVQQRDARLQIRRRVRDAHERARGAGLRRIEAVVRRSDFVHGVAEHRIALDVADALAFEVSRAAVVERSSILGAGHHEGGLLEC